MLTEFYVLKDLMLIVGPRKTLKLKLKNYIQHKNNIYYFLFYKSIYLFLLFIFNLHDLRENIL